MSYYLVDEEAGELVECIECGQNIMEDEDYVNLLTGDYVCEDCASEWGEGDVDDEDRTADDSFDECGE